MTSAMAGIIGVSVKVPPGERISWIESKDSTMIIYHSGVVHSLYSLQKTPAAVVKGAFNLKLGELFVDPNTMVSLTVLVEKNDQIISVQRRDYFEGRHNLTYLFPDYQMTQHYIYDFYFICNTSYFTHTSFEWHSEAIPYSIVKQISLFVTLVTLLLLFLVVMSTRVPKFLSKGQMVLHELEVKCYYCNRRVRTIDGICDFCQEELSLDQENINLPTFIDLVIREGKYSFVTIIFKHKRFDFRAEEVSEFLRYDLQRYLESDQEYEVRENKKHLIVRSGGILVVFQKSWVAKTNQLLNWFFG